MLGTQTRGGKMEGADESAELWRPAPPPPKKVSYTILILF